MNSNDTRRSWMVGGGVLGVAALALATFLLWPSTSTPCPPLLTVRTNPEGALVSLDGRSLGTTPFSDLALADPIKQAVLRIASRSPPQPPGHSSEPAARTVGRRGAGKAGAVPSHT